ncbi:flippase [Oscillochloris sp. ZM17-4]|uniref:flippase n=1 Tax=Oscillochloris sp. ZM17-4 TaxID=2866714 RepID=UPI001C732D44|nr:flippase [Oscillochloris sp. ZM17-4]MBX0328826.1 flippase [Oscillochloris sp. ZM17-4]
MISGKTIAKNVGVMMASQLITWVMAFILAIFLPRYVGAEAIGAITIATSVWLIMSVLYTFGMDTHLTKSIARDPSKTSELLSTSLVLRTIFFLIGCVIVALYARIMQYDLQLTTVIWIMGSYFLTSSYAAAFNASLIGLERMEFISISNIVGKTLLTAVSLLMIYLNAGLYLVISVMTFSSLVSCTILFISLNRQQPLRFQVDFSNMRAVARDSSVYLVSGLAMVIYQQIDKPFISALVDTTTVGWYGTAMNLFGTLMFLPVVFSSVVFPAMARSYASGNNKLNIIAQRSFDLMFLISIPVGLGLVVIGQPLVDLLYGPQFRPSGGILMMLGVVLIFTYLNTILGQLLISTDRTSRWNIVMIVAIVVTLPIDYVMVPWTHQVYGNGGLGGTFAFLITEFAMVVAAILLLPPKTLQWSNVRTASLTLLSGLLMMATSWWFRETMMLVSIGIAAVTYIGAVALLRIVPSEDVLLIKNAVMGIIGRLRRRKDASASLGN